MHSQTKDKTEFITLNRKSLLAQVGVLGSFYKYALLFSWCFSSLLEWIRI
jgi:hypothetical protein